MKCLIPIHQEKYPEKSMERAKHICDEVNLIYIVDKNIIEKVKREASYTIPSYALEDLEKFIIEIQRKESKKIEEEMKKYVKTNLKFKIGEYYEIIEKEVLKDDFDIIMIDDYNPAFLNFKKPIWIEKGIKIENCTFIVYSISKIKRLKEQISFSKKLVKKIGCKFSIYYLGEEEEVIETLRKEGEIIEEIKGELLIIQKHKKMKIEGKANILIL